MLGVVAGAGIGLGFWLLITGWRPRPLPLAEALARYDAHLAGRAASAASAVVEPATGWAARVGGPLAARLTGHVQLVPGRLAADLTLLARGVQQQAAEKTAGAVLGLALAGAVAAVLTAAGLGLPAEVWLAATALLAAVGFVIPDVVVAAQARQVRARMRHGLSAFLDLAVVSLAAGCGVEQALTHAAGTGDGPIFIRLRQALAAAQASRASPWTALANLGLQLGLPELRELAASVQLAGTEGARIRGSLAAKATTLRARLLAEAETAAASATERMSVAVIALFAGFLVLVGYPALATVLNL